VASSLAVFEAAIRVKSMHLIIKSKHVQNPGKRGNMEIKDIFT